MPSTLQGHSNLARGPTLSYLNRAMDETEVKDPSVTLWVWPSAAAKQTGATMTYLPLVELGALKALMLALFVIRSLIP